MEVRKKKRIFQVSCIIGLITLMLFTLSACWERKIFTYAEVYKSNWDIDVPDNMDDVFYVSESGLGGEGVRYGVLKAETEPTDFIADFFKEKDEKFEKAVDKEIAHAKVHFEIPGNLLPDWDTAYYWKHIGKGAYWEEYEFYQNNLYIVYFPDSLMFIFCESFT